MIAQYCLVLAHCDPTRSQNATLLQKKGLRDARPSAHWTTWSGCEDCDRLSNMRAPCIPRHAAWGAICWYCDSGIDNVDTSLRMMEGQMRIAQ